LPSHAVCAQECGMQRCWLPDVCGECMPTRSGLAARKTVSALLRIDCLQHQGPGSRLSATSHGWGAGFSAMLRTGHSRLTATASPECSWLSAEVGCRPTRMRREGVPQLTSSWRMSFIGTSRRSILETGSTPARRGPPLYISIHSPVSREASRCPASLHVTSCASSEIPQM
jgi:hypothetical protein